MANFYLTLIIALLIGGFALNTWIDFLNLKSLASDLPEEFRGLYDPEKYRTYLSYQRDNTRLTILRRSFGLVAILLFILMGGFNALDVAIRGLGFGPILTGVLYIGALSALHFLITLPFDIYHTFAIEERYGFNKTSPATFAFDIVKGILLSAILGGPILALVLYFFDVAGDLAWLYCWLALTAIQLVLAFLAPAVIMPIFNKFEPLPEGELRKAIERYAREQNFHLSGIFQMDGSRRSTKSNAFFTGFGKLRRLVLFDTLIQKQSTEEVISVLAHEIGHFKEGHIPKSIALSIASSALVFWFLSLFLGNPDLFEAFQMESVSIYASLVLVSFLFAPVSQAVSIIASFISRKHEFEADRFAKTTTKNAETLVSALKKLSIDHLSHLTPHPLKVFLDYSHPPVLERIKALRK